MDEAIRLSLKSPAATVGAIRDGNEAGARQSFLLHEFQKEKQPHHELHMSYASFKELLCCILKPIRFA